MSETEQEPVVEQTPDSPELEVSTPIEEVAPTTSIETEEVVAEVPDEPVKPELNYLADDLFSDIRQISMENLSLIHI